MAARSDGDIVERARIKKLGVNFHVTTDDGSLGEKGFVTRSVESFIKAHAHGKDATLCLRSGRDA